jgi:hypothetical protein
MENTIETVGVRDKLAGLESRGVGKARDLVERTQASMKAAIVMIETLF